MTSVSTKSEEFLFIDVEDGDNDLCMCRCGSLAEALYAYVYYDEYDEKKEKKDGYDQGGAMIWCDSCDGEYVICPYCKPRKLEKVERKEKEYLDAKDYLSGKKKTSINIPDYYTFKYRKRQLMKITAICTYQIYCGKWKDEKEVRNYLDNEWKKDKYKLLRVFHKDHNYNRPKNFLWLDVDCLKVEDHGINNLDTRTGGSLYLKCYCPCCKNKITVDCSGC